MTETSLEKLKVDVLTPNYPEIASRLIVHDQPSLDKANAFTLVMKGLISDVKDTFKPIKQKIDASKNETLEKERGFLGPLNKAKGTADLKIITYIEDLKEKKREAEKKAQEAETARLKAVQLAMKEAEVLEEKGHEKEAREMRDRVPEFKPTAIPEIPKLKGAHLRENWKFKVTDLKLLIKMRPDLIMADKVEIGKLVRIHKEKTDIPGVEVWNESSLPTKG